jgi:hypothetical protein
LFTWNGASSSGSIQTFSSSVLALNPLGNNVGIGTTAPFGKLSVSVSSAVPTPSGSMTSGLAVHNTGVGRAIQFGVYEAGAYNFIQSAYVNNADTGTPLAVFIGNAERARFTADGLTFNGDTAAANALDDYEEGTFTPIIEGHSTAGTATYVVQSGRYTKIGNQVNVQIDLSWNSGTGTGNLQIVGLPFTNVSNNMAGTIGFIEDITLIALNYATMYVAPSSTRFDFVQSPVGGGAVSSITYDAAGRLIVSSTYFTS